MIAALNAAVLLALGACKSDRQIASGVSGEVEFSVDDICSAFEIVLELYCEAYMSEWIDESRNDFIYIEAPTACETAIRAFVEERTGLNIQQKKDINLGDDGLFYDSHGNIVTEMHLHYVFQDEVTLEVSVDFRHAFLGGSQTIYTVIRIDGRWRIMGENMGWVS